MLEETENRTFEGNEAVTVGCYVMWSGVHVPTFRRYIFLSQSRKLMEAVYSSETQVHIYQTTGRLCGHVFITEQILFYTNLVTPGNTTYFSSPLDAVSGHKCDADGYGHDA